MTNLGRRDTLGLIGCGAATLASGITPAHAMAKRKQVIAFDNPSDKLRAYMLMRGALDDQLVIGCISGRYFGVVESELLPLYGVVSATFARYRPRAKGGYDGVSLEYAYFIDLQTGQPLSHWRNPYTDEVVEVPHGGYAPAHISIMPDLSLKPAQMMADVNFANNVQPVEVRGDDVWFTELTTTSRAASGAAQPFRYSESVILHARRSELEQAGVKRVPCETSFTATVSWRPWLKMGNRAGHLLAVGAGRYGATLETLPPEWLSAVRAQHPELLHDPKALLEPLWKN